MKTSRSNRDEIDPEALRALAIAVILRSVKDLITAMAYYREANKKTAGDWIRYNRWTYYGQIKEIYLFLTGRKSHKIISTFWFSLAEMDPMTAPGIVRAVKKIIEIDGSIEVPPGGLTKMSAKTYLMGPRPVPCLNIACRKMSHKNNGTGLCHKCRHRLIEWGKTKRKTPVPLIYKKGKWMPNPEKGP